MSLSVLEWLSEIFNDTKHRAVSLRQLSLSIVCHFRSVGKFQTLINPGKTLHFFGVRYYVTFGICHPSVVHLSSVCLSVTLLLPTQRLELSGNIIAASNSLGTRKVCIKILGKLKGVQGDHTSWMEGCMKNWRFSTNTFVLFRKRYKIRP